MKKTTKAFIVLSVLWMGFIFLMSAQSKENSAKVSDGVTAVIVDTLYGDDKPKTAEEAGWKYDEKYISKSLEKGLVPKEDLFGRSRFYFKNDVRKMAHLMVYMVLAIFVNLCFLSHFGKNKVKYIFTTFVKKIK